MLLAILLACVRAVAPAVHLLLASLMPMAGSVCLSGSGAQLEAVQA